VVKEREEKASLDLSRSLVEEPNLECQVKTNIIS